MSTSSECQTSFGRPTRLDDSRVKKNFFSPVSDFGICSAKHMNTSHYILYDQL